MYRLKNFFIRSLAVFLSVLVLSTSIFSSYIGAITVYATGADVSLTGAFTALYEIFLGVGSTVLLSTGVINDVEDITEFDVAQFGADFMVEKMGLSAETADIICDAFLPNDPHEYAQGYADAFTAYENGEMSLEELKNYNPVNDSSLNVYINGLFDDLWNGISSFVDDVVAGSNDIALGGYVFTANDVGYTGYIDSSSYLMQITLSNSKGEKLVASSPIACDNGIVRPYGYINSSGALDVYYMIYTLASDGSYVYFNTYTPTFGGEYTYSSGSVGSWSSSIKGIYVQPYYSAGSTYICNFPVFYNGNGFDLYKTSCDDSGCINKELSFEISDVISGLSSSFSNFASRGAYKAIDLYNSLVDTFASISSGAISDASTYVDSVSSIVDAIPFTSVSDSEITVDPIPTTSPIEKPASDADLIEWVKYIADTLSMSWSFGSDIPDFLTGIGDYVQDIPDILTGLNDGFSDVIEIGGNTWEVVARIPDIIDKQGEATQEVVSQGFTDVIDIGGSIAEKVAEMPDIIDFAKDGILAGLIDLDNSLSIPLSGILEGINSHTGLLEGIKDGVLSIPDSISSSIDKVITDVQDIGASIIDYTGLLQLIIELLKSILAAIQDILSLLTGWFVIDFDAIKAHLLLALASIPAFDDFDSFLAMVTDIKGQITDSYEYPKITMQTPDILKQFIKTDEILLLDFKDYANIFIWVRTAMAFAILFGFFMWCVRDLKVELTLN